MAGVKALRKELNTLIKQNQSQLYKNFLMKWKDDIASIAGGQDETGECPLATAGECGREIIVKDLLECGVSVDAMSRGGYTGLELASSRGHSSTALEFIHHGADVNHCDESGSFSLYVASKYGFTDVVRTLIDSGAIVDLQDAKQFSSLMVATREKHVDVAALLLEKGANVDLQFQKRYNSLWLATWKKHTELMRTLLEYGASANSVSETNTSLLNFAVTINFIEGVKLLLESGAEVDHQKIDGMTSIHLASVNGNLSVIRELLRYNPDINITDNNGNTALDICMYKGHYHCADELNEYTRISSPERESKRSLRRVTYVIAKDVHGEPVEEAASTAETREDDEKSGAGCSSSFPTLIFNDDNEAIEFEKLAHSHTGETIKLVDADDTGNKSDTEVTSESSWSSDASGEHESSAMLMRTGVIDVDVKSLVSKFQDVGAPQISQPGEAINSVDADDIGNKSDTEVTDESPGEISLSSDASLKPTKPNLSVTELRPTNVRMSGSEQIHEYGHYANSKQRPRKKEEMEINRQKGNGEHEASAMLMRTGVIDVDVKSLVDKFQDMGAPQTSQPAYPGNISHGTEIDVRSSTSGTFRPDITEEWPYTVHVEPCTQAFYNQFKHMAYRMSSSPRGHACIINIQQGRKGTDQDRDKMKELMEQLDFQVQVYNDEDDLSAEGIRWKLEAFSQLDGHTVGSCCIVVILGHGQESSIKAADGNDITIIPMIKELFNNNKCKLLAGKPKLFFIQACRGNIHDGIPEDNQDSNQTVADSAHVKTKKEPSFTDVIIGYPTQPGYVAYRNEKEGSWYIQTLVKVIMKYAKTEDLCSMLHMVNDYISAMVTKQKNPKDGGQYDCKQMASYESQLRKPKFFFFPGIKK